MTSREVDVSGHSYRFSPIDPPRGSNRLRSVLRWVVRDEITGDAPEIDYGLTSEHAGLAPRVGRGGVMGLVGRPGQLFPGLDTGSTQLRFLLAAPGYLPRRLTADLGPVAGFPDDFTPADLGTILLHRTPVVLRGRVARRTGLGPEPLGGVAVSLAGVWSTAPAPSLDPDLVIEPPFLASLFPGLYGDRVQTSDLLRRCDMTLAIGEEKRLVGPVAPGDSRVRLSDRLLLNPGDVLAFEPTDPDRVEYIEVSAVLPASTDDQPADITLVHPLALEHRPDAVCVRATPQAPMIDNSFARDGVPGERVAVLSGLTDLVSGCVVEIRGGPAPREYQTVALYQTSSDADGYFRLPPLSRVAAVKLHAERGDLPAPAEPVVSPDYRRYENLIDVVFPP